MPSHQNGMYGLHQAENNFNSFNKITSLPKILRSNGIKTGSKTALFSNTLYTKKLSRHYRQETRRPSRSIFFRLRTNWRKQFNFPSRTQHNSHKTSGSWIFKQHYEVVLFHLMKHFSSKRTFSVHFSCTLLSTIPTVVATPILNMGNFVSDLVTEMKGWVQFLTGNPFTIRLMN